jgi:hypothetical protein
MDDTTAQEIFDRISELAAAPPEVAEHLADSPGRDEATGPVLEILSGRRWFAVDRRLWDGWTGLRRVNGVDHHGPITYLDSPVSNPKPYTGSRSCGCRVCEASVPPSLRKN